MGAIGLTLARIIPDLAVNGPVGKFVLLICRIDFRQRHAYGNLLRSQSWYCVEQGEVAHET
jgi:hypothetical protein